MEFVDRQRRYTQMLGVMVKHDLSFVLERLGLSAFVPDGAGAAPGEEGKATPLSTPERVKRVFEDLGPTFVKMGQILSTRPDLLPPAYLDEFKKLQDDVGALPFEEVRAVAEEDLGKPLDELFAEVDEQPLAAASIGQVHRVVLLDGTAAVVKIQRPGIEQTIRMDLSILRSFAQLARASGMLGTLDPVAIVTEFERSILRELDYVVEGHTTEDFIQQHADDDGIVIPAVHWDTSSKRVLTLDYVEGIKVSEIDRLRSSGHDLPAVAAKLVETVLQQIFVHGLFHADPHPGNLLVLQDGRLGIIDFGMSGRFDRYIRKALVDMMGDLVERDYRKLADHLLAHELIGYDADLRSVRADLRELFRGASAGEMADQMEVLIQFIVSHEVAFPPDLFFLDKVFGTLDGAIKTLDPKLTLKNMARTFLPGLVQSAVSDWQTLARQLMMRIFESEGTLVDLPIEVGKVLRRLDAGHLQIRNAWTLSEDGVRKVSRLAVQCAGLALGLIALGFAAVGGLAAPQGGVAAATWIALATGVAALGGSAVWCLRSR